jgi:tetratricopeptide (TPR) repeat protein
MAKAGRNEPCPCGSNKKYKQCCLAKDQAAERAALAERSASQTPDSPGFKLADMVERLAAALPLEDDGGLAEASNAVVDLVHAGKLDEAERAAHDLIERFPDVHDGYDRLGMVHEARGDNRKAVECYRRVIALIRSHPDVYEPEFENVFQELIEKLEPPLAAPAP